VSRPSVGSGARVVLLAVASFLSGLRCCGAG